MHQPSPVPPPRRGDVVTALREGARALRFLGRCLSLWLQACRPSSATLPATQRSAGFPEVNQTFKIPNFYFCCLGGFVFFFFLNEISNETVKDKGIPASSETMKIPGEAAQFAPAMAGRQWDGCLAQPPLWTMLPGRNPNIAFKSRLGKTSSTWVGGWVASSGCRL